MQIVLRENVKIKCFLAHYFACAARVRLAVYRWEYFMISSNEKLSQIETFNFPGNIEQLAKKSLDKDGILKF